MTTDIRRALALGLLLALLGVSTTAAAGDADKYHDALSDAQAKDGLALFEGAAKSPKGDLYDAAIQFYAAEVRVTSDVDCFPPTETGHDSPMLVYDAIHADLADKVNQVLQDPALYGRVIARLKDWDPSTSPGYKPAWESKSACDDYAKLAQGYKEKLLKPMQDMASLLQIPAYKRAFDVDQAFNLASEDEREKPGKEKQARDAEDVILRIEKQKGLDVLSSAILRNRQASVKGDDDDDD